MQNTLSYQEKQKLSQMSSFTKILRGLSITNNELAIHLPINIKYTVMLAYRASPILTTPYSISLVLCETHVRDYQYNTDATKYHYL